MQTWVALDVGAVFGLQSMVSDLRIDFSRNSTSIASYRYCLSSPNICDIDPDKAGKSEGEPKRHLHPLFQGK